MTRKPRLVHNVCLLSLLAISIITPTPVAPAAQQLHPFPADYLIPPPLPTPQHLKHQNAPAQHAAASAPVPSHTATSTTSNVVEPPGFMTRIARWFGLGAAEQNQLANGFSSDSKQAYNYAQPLGADGKPCNLCNKYPWVPMFPLVMQQNQAVASANNHLAQHVQQHPHQQQQQLFDAQASQKYSQKQSLPYGSGGQQQLPVKQRAVQFNFPTLYQPPKSGAHKAVPVKVTAPPPFIPVPLPIPSLSLNALPPIYNARPFRLPYLTPAASTTTTTTTESMLSGEQQLPSTEPARFTENIGAPSELQPDRVKPEQTYSTFARDPDPSFEIVKSHQLTDFVSSVEYPITYEQSPSIDLGHQPVHVNEEPANESVATALYQHQTLSPNVHKHLPASQILTELGSFKGTQQTQQPPGSEQTAGWQQQTPHSQQTQQGQPYQDTQSNSQQQPQAYQQTHSTYQPTSQQQAQASHSLKSQEQQELTQTYEPSTTHYTTPYVPQTQYQQHNYETQKTAYEPQGEDNFPSASSHNLTKVQHLQQNHDYKPWLPLGQTFAYTTTELPLEFDISTQLPQLSEVNFVTERVQESTRIQFSQPPQPQIPKRTEAGKHDTRETPKRLLDSPIRHAQGLLNQPRPFTRDPSELNLRIPAAPFVPPEHHHNHKQSPIGVLGFPSTPLLVTPQPPLSPNHRGVAAEPTPTSTYSAIDASGQYAGISPPTPPTPLPARHKDIHQIIIPYTTRNKPRPFEPSRNVDSAFHKWSTQQNSVDIHEQQESKVVSAKLSTETPPPGQPRRTTKYITRILASNLRDLLRREHDSRQNKSNSSSFDLLKWQRNIDNWTEQEYTSLSHRPSTPTIRGRSKHIPTEYLTTTTPSPRRPKTTISLFEPSSELPASINELQALLLERGSQHFELNQIDDEIDKHLLDTLEGETATVSTVTSTRTSTTQHPTNSNGHAAPSFMHLGSEIEQPEPEELWRKAKVSISPQTHEKVYVVTPQPRFFPQRVLSLTTTEQPTGIGKSPRFLVRPTPGNGTKSSRPASNFYNPELFGLMGLSAYVPAKPVEIIDGNSKVFNIITTTPANNEDEPTTISPIEVNNHWSVVKKARRLRSTMLPSPR